jgi:hypothetical protein
MKKINYLFSNILIILSVFTVSCSDKGDTPAPAPTKTENITRSPWKFQSASAAGSDVSSNPLLACFIDNTITFSTTLSFTNNEGAVVCSASSPGGTWSFGSSETQLVLSAPLLPGSSSTFTLVSLNETNLVVSQNVVIQVGVPAIPVTFTFRH